MILQEIKNLQSWIFSVEPKISIPWITNYGLGTASSNCKLNEFVNVKFPILN